jgi:hypothetical protein
LGFADATGAIAIRIGPRTYSMTGPAPPDIRRDVGSAMPVDSTGVVNALLGGSIARRLRLRRRRRRRASAAAADGESASALARCLGCLGTRLRASTVISPGPSMPSSASSAAVFSITS